MSSAFLNGVPFLNFSLSSGGQSVEIAQLVVSAEYDRTAHCLYVILAWSIADCRDDAGHAEFSSSRRGLFSLPPTRIAY
ncbi:hypothetical protein A0H81_05162 [Grifola frondosa]|uniref:Uncharacterized protein n=1 Tax=Grifola frondosa TaxID=5627 RepID=A0A1C7MBR0_GRIFR|nr:hypothetical protein A0H81_05162 [Grifola frondosa]